MKQLIGLLASFVRSLLSFRVDLELHLYLKTIMRVEGAITMTQIAGAQSLSITGARIWSLSRSPWPNTDQVQEGLARGGMGLPCLLATLESLQRMLNLAIAFFLRTPH